jgi:protein-S-isoprenylcysteine O-methyltransferase Ste14
VVYAWSTVELGTRFSNLTYRGTVATGPYRLMKHPAYVSKVVSYWLIAVPFVPLYGWLFAAQQCVVLLLSCSIYYLRGKYEEKHLSQYAEYRAYAASTTGRAFLDVYAGAVNRALGRV